MTSKKSIKIQGSEISVITKGNNDYISLTDMLKSKDGDFFISDCLRNRNTIEFLSIWEEIYNPDFNYGESAIIKSKAGLNNYKLSVKQWRDENPDLDGNIRDQASIEQLIVLSNLESVNSMLINQGLDQKDRLQKLNDLAIKQMKSLISNKNIKKLQ